MYVSWSKSISALNSLGWLFEQSLVYFSFFRDSRSLQICLCVYFIIISRWICSVSLRDAVRPNNNLCLDGKIFVLITGINQGCQWHPGAWGPPPPPQLTVWLPATFKGLRLVVHLSYEHFDVISVVYLICKNIEGKELITCPVLDYQ